MELLTVQKANFWKRLSAWLLDTVLAITLAMGVAALLSAVLGYDKINEELAAHQTKYEETYGIDFSISQEDFNKLTEEEQAEYNKILEEAEKAFVQDKEVQAILTKMFTMTLVMLSVSALISVLAFYFIIPLFFKNGKTLGKKVFGLAVVRSNCVKVSNKVLFIRTLFGLYTIETMFPILLVAMIYFGMIDIVGTITLLLFFILQIGVMIGTKNNSSIHDLLADTVVVDSESQRIFDTQEAFQEYIKEQKKIEAQKAEY